MSTAREFADRAAALAAEARGPDPAIQDYALVSIALSLATSSLATSRPEPYVDEMVRFLDELMKWGGHDGYWSQRAAKFYGVLRDKSGSYAARPFVVLEELRAEIVALDRLTKPVGGAPRGPLQKATHNTLLTVLEAIDRRAAYLAGVGA